MRVLVIDDEPDVVEIVRLTFNLRWPEAEVFSAVTGEDGKEVFFHRSGLNAGDYDALNEGDAVEYVVQEGPRGARAEHVRGVSDAPASAPAPPA